MSIFSDALDWFSGTASDVVDTAGSVLKGVGSIFDDFGGDDIWNTVRSLANTGLDYYASTEAADAAMKAGKSASEIFDANANLFDTEALNVEQKTQRAMTMQRYNGLKFLGQQQASYAKAGVTMEGSPLIVMKETRDLIETSIIELQQEGQANAANLRARADIERQRAQNALDEGNFKAEATLTNSVIKSGRNLLGI